MSKTLMILFPEKAPDTKHICYRGGCPLFTGEVQDGLCKTLWETPPESMKGKTACMCNFYDTRNPVIVEADGVDIQETIKRVEGKQQEPQGLDEAAEKYESGIGSQDYCYLDVRDAFKAGAKWMAEHGVTSEGIVEEQSHSAGLTGRYFVAEVERNKLDDFINDNFKPGDQVIVQIRKKEE